MEYRKNDIVTLEIVDCGTDGEGIGKADGFTVFVKDAVIGDTVTAKIMKAKKNYGYGRLIGDPETISIPRRAGVSVSPSVWRLSAADSMLMRSS